MFRTTCGSGFSRYRVMVKYPGILLRTTRSFVPHARQLKSPILLFNWCPPCLSFTCFLLYSYHSSLVIGILLSLVVLKECGLSTRSLGMGWPLSKVGTPVGVEEDLFQSSPTHKSGTPSWSETENTTLHNTLQQPRRKPIPLTMPLQLSDTNFPTIN